MKIIDAWIAYKEKIRKEESDRFKYELCGRALQEGICNQECYMCAWNVKRGEEDDK